MKTIQVLFSRYKYILLVLILSFLAGKSLLVSGLPPTHDGEYHVIRFYEFDKSIRDGNFYPRWAPDLNNEYGIPLFNFVYPFPNYFSSALHVLGISFIDAFKGNLFVAILTGAVLFYLWVKLFWGNAGGIIAATFYTFTPYHFVDIYVRGSVGEVWALAFFPGFLWAVSCLFLRKDKRYATIAGVFLALIIVSHNILAEMFFIFATVYCIFFILTSNNKRFFFLQILKTFLIGLGLTTIFWLPALMEIQYVRGLQIFDISRNFPELYQLLIPSWGTGFSGGDIDNEMSFQIGLANLFAVFCSITGLFWLRKRKDNRDLRIVIFFICSFIVTFFLMLPASLPLWEKIPFFNYFQFPWRFLSIIMLITSFLAGVFGSVIRSQKILWIVTFSMCFLSIVLSYSYTIPAYYHLRDDEYYVSRDNFIHGTNSPGNSFNTIWFTASTSARPRQEYFVNKSSYRKYEIIAKTPRSMQEDIAYFPGWSIYVNGRQTDSYPSDEGLLTFQIPEGHSMVEAQFNDTIVRALAKFVSLMTLILMIVSSLVVS